MLNLDDARDGLTKLLRPWPRGAGVGAGAPDGCIEVELFGANPGNLRMLARVPRGLQPGAALVVVLHGCTQTAAGFADAAGWSALADQHGFALLLPEQRRANNANLCFDWFRPEDITRGTGEIASIRAMTEHMLTHYGLDPGRAFVTGLSAGGAMAGALLAAYPELFAGGAIIAGLPYGCASSVQEAFDSMMRDHDRPARAWGDAVRAASPHRGAWPSISIWQGEADGTVRPSNARELLKQWLDVHALAGAPDVSDRVDGAAHRAWRGRDGRIAVEAYLVPGMDHGAPIAPRARDPEQRCGHVAPFVLDAGIASSHRIARSWGLLSATAAQTWPVPMPEQPPSRPAAARRTLDPAAVIDKALRAAGLVRRG